MKEEGFQGSILPRVYLGGQRGSTIDNIGRG